MTLLIQNEARYGAERPQHPRYQDMNTSYSEFLATVLITVFEYHQPKYSLVFSVLVSSVSVPVFLVSAFGFYAWADLHGQILKTNEIWMKKNYTQF
jgi:hypothetical protein